MASGTKTRPTPRTLLEWSASSASGSPLTVDRGAGVIKGVKVIGRFSRNNHGLREATGGTEYTAKCLQEALELYEGVDVMVDHEESAHKGRSSFEIFGKLRNVRLTEDGVRADLHYLKSHPLSERVCEDVERALGAFGLSHDASAAKERFDRSSKRLVIEKLATVRSVDLVRKPASNRNLWESEMPKTTLREIMENFKELTPVRAKWRKRLLEDAAMAAPIDAPMDPAPEGGTADDALKAGFKAAMLAVLDDDTMDLAAKKKKIGELLTTQEKLTQEKEPEEPKQESEGDDKDKKDKADEDKKESEKVKQLEHKIAVRDLCETAGIKADKTLIESLESLPLESARRLVEREKARGTGSGSPRSSGYGSGGTNGGGSNGYKPPASTKEFAASIKT